MNETWNLTTSPIGYTGKLPPYGDFVRQNVVSPAARSFEVWQAEGLSQFPAQVGNGWERAFDTAAPFFFVIGGGERNNFIVGVSLSSRDKSGRRYPFSLFSTSNSEGQYYLLPSAFGPFLQAARQAVEGEWPKAVDAVYGRKIVPLVSTLPQLSSEAGRAFENYLATRTIKDFFAGLFGSFERVEKYLVMNNLFKTLIPLRGREPARFNFSLRLPLVSSEAGEAERQVGFWMVLCHKALGYGLPFPHIFWNQTGRLHIFFRPPETKFFPFLLIGGADNNLIWDLTRLGKEKLVKVNLPARLVERLDSPEEKLAALLNLKEWERSYGG